MPEQVWLEFMRLYGGGPPIQDAQFEECKECKIEEEQLRLRRKEESKHIKKIDR